ncbi:hypothetical protein RQP46_000775 [Phenoliferia psychrophenolica]
MEAGDFFSEPVASTSRGIFTLPYKPPAAPQGEEQEQEQEEDDLLRRRQLYETAWGACHERIQATVARLHDASLDEIKHFVHSTSTADSPTNLLAALTGRPPIRTGLIIGAGPGTSSLLFSALSRQLVDSEEGRDPCIVSRFTSRECSNIKSAMRALISGFVGSAAPDVEDDQDGEDEAGPVGVKSAALTPEDMHNLVAWYSRRSRTGTSRPTLVVLLEDLEAMDGKVLAQMVDVLSRYTHVLPIVFLLGVATSSNALHEVLPRRSTNLLDVAKFYVEPGIGTFNALIRGLFIDWDAPLGLGPDVFAYLLKTFQDMHQSIDAIVSNLQYLYLDHFTNRPYAHFTSSSPPPTIFTESSLKPLLSLPSLKKASKDDAVKKLKNGSADECRLEVGQFRETQRQRHGQRQSAFHLLLFVQSHWKEDNGRSVEDLLDLLFAGDLEEVSDELCRMILVSDFGKIDDFLTSSVERLDAFRDAYPAASPDFYEELESHRQTIEKLRTKPKSHGRVNFVNSNILGAESTLGEGDREFSRLVQELTKMLRERAAFQPTSNLVLHELWYANDITPLQEFHPSILPSYVASLKAADESTDGPRSDVAVAYRLYRETGKLINLGDWWSTFDLNALDEPASEEEKDEEEAAPDPKGKGKGKAKAATNGKGKKRARSVESEEEEEEEEREEDDPARRKQARFLRAVGDLALAGFLQPTARKAEHALKSVF